MNKLLWAEKFGSILGFIIFGSLAFIALSEKAISFGSPKSVSINHQVGFSAIVTGILFMAGALASLGYLTKNTAYFRLYFILALGGWIAFIVWYITLFG